jgi:hypothetical protein
MVTHTTLHTKHVKANLREEHETGGVVVQTGLAGFMKDQAVSATALHQAWSSIM